MIAVLLIVLGAILLIYEAFSPGAFLVIPGTVLVILGLVGAAYTDILVSWWSPVIAVAIAVPVTLLTVKGYQKLAKPAPPTTTVAGSLVGRKGVVTVATEAGSMKGKVKIDSDVWSATSDEPIGKGAEVVVDHSEGVHVHVRKVRGERFGR
jgi:membrane protein implicated in regulation of membrane protease activity